MANLIVLLMAHKMEHSNVISYFCVKLLCARITMDGLILKQKRNVSKWKQYKLFIGNLKTKENTIKMSFSGYKCNKEILFQHDVLNIFRYYCDSPHPSAYCIT